MSSRTVTLYLWLVTHAIEGWPVSQWVWQVKRTLTAQLPEYQLLVKICSPSPVMGTSPNEWNILEWYQKTPKQTNKNKNAIPPFWSETKTILFIVHVPKAIIMFIVLAFSKALQRWFIQDNTKVVLYNTIIKSISINTCWRAGKLLPVMCFYVYNLNNLERGKVTIVRPVCYLLCNYLMSHSSFSYNFDYS